MGRYDSSPAFRPGSVARVVPGLLRALARAAAARLMLLLAAVLLVAPAAARAATVTAAAGGNPTIVSLTFDDGTATQYWALGQLKTHNMAGTFFINSARPGTSDYYMTWKQIHDLSVAGDEIGGHTSDHVDLPQTDPAEARRQVCDDRANLISQGYAATDFAYPYGDYNAGIEQLVASCGYNSARTSTIGAETNPPADRYAIRSGATSSSLADYENAVTAAEQRGGGWVPVTFHQICNACDTDWISQSDFSSFLTWLRGQESTNNVVVERVSDVIGGSVAPPVTVPLPPAPNGQAVMRNASLEFNTGVTTAPDCYTADQTGANTAAFSWTNDAHSGSWAERIDMSNYSSGDAKLYPTQDMGQCTPSVTPGHTYVATEWYKSTVPVAFAGFARDSLGAFAYWDSSPTFPASATWKKASWTTQAVPNGMTGLSFGLTITANGSVTVDDFGLQDSNPTGPADTTPPVVTLSSPSAGATVAGTVAISASASDNVAVDHVDYLVDGNVVGSTTNGLNTYNWYTRNLAGGPHTIAVRAVDPAGNVATTAPITVTVSNSPTNLLPNPSLETAGSGGPACWLLGGYGTNTFAWSGTTDAHTGSSAENLTISAWTSGDRKLVSAQDSGACAPAGTPGHSYTVSGWYKVPSGATATPRFFAYYRSSAGVWTYWTQSPLYPSNATWTQETWSTPALPAGATNISIGMGLQNTGSVTMDDFGLYDNSPPADTTPPTSSIACNGSSDGGGCAAGWYGGPVQVQLTATDDLGGSGVAAIRYTTDGSTPTMSNGTTYSGPFTVGATTTVRYRAFDNAGNAETTHTQLIQVDTTPPVSTIGCGAASCQAGWYNSATSVSLSATDNASGVAFIRYTTDGSDPTLTNGQDYVGPFSLSATTTVKYRAYDNAGNAEPVNSQLIAIDTSAPNSAISCGGAPCQNGWYGAPQQVALSATDNAGGSGVYAIYYTTDGSTPTATSADLYTGSFAVGATTTVRYFALDYAGNAEPMNTAVIQIDTTPPTSTISCNGAACPTGWTNGSIAVRLSATDAAGGSGVAGIIFTTDGSDPTTTNGNTYAGAFSLSATTTVKYRAIDQAGNLEPVNTQLIQIDPTPPSSTISCNASACSSSPYVNGVSVALAASDNGGGAGIAGVYYTTDGSTPTATSADAYTGSFTITATTTVKYFAVDNAGNVEPVNTQVVNVAAAGVTLTSPAAGATVSGTTNLSATVSGISVDHVTFYVDGGPVGTVSASPYTLAWNSSTVPDGAHTVVAAAFDASGAETQSAPTTITVSNGASDTTPPTSSISCNGAGCAGGWYTGSVSVSLSAVDDPGGSGVASIVYTTDGSDPSTTNGQVYSGSFSVASTTTVKYRAYDNAGNAEAVNTQLIRLDTVAPQSSVSCNGGPCASTFYTGAVSVTLSASDNPGGSGVAAIIYTTDGSAPSSTNGNTYTGPISVSTTTRVRYRAVDVAGNLESGSSVLVQVDTSPPSSSIGCNGAACTGGWYTGAVSVSLSATDNPGGSGVAFIRYTTDGSDPSLSNGQAYSGSFSVPSTTTVKYRAYDNAGNAEAVNAQPVRVDAVSPTSSMSCNGSSCASAFYANPVSLTLSATDNSGGSGVSAIVYTVDGSTPTLTNGLTYSGAFSVATTTTVRYRAFDVAGNAEPVNSGLIQVDTTPPASSISCNGSPCGPWAAPGVSIGLSASDNSGGSGVASIRYTTDGSTPSLTNGTRYTTPFTLSATTTIKYRAYDNVGNPEPVNTQLVQIDGTAPKATLTAPTGGLVSGAVALTATASDNVGVDHVDFLVDGTVVATVRSAPYQTSWNSAAGPDGTHAITARAVDLAGNTTTSSAVNVTVVNNNLLSNPGLESATGGAPSCWLTGGYGTNTFTWTYTTDAHSGAHAENLNVTSFTSGDRKLVNTQDSGTCAPAVSPGHSYTVTAWYKVPSGTAAPRLFAYYRTSSGWVYWTQSPLYASVAGWTQVAWTTPAVPVGATNLSIGMGLQNAGTVTMDDFGLFQTG